MFHLIDREHWNREEAYRHYREEVPCTYSMCVNLRITRLLEEVERSGLKLFPVFLYGLTQTVNRHREFRMRLNEREELGYFDSVFPCYTIFDQDTENFSTRWTEYREEFASFYSQYLRDSREQEKREEPENLFDVSCIPWASFTGFHLNIQGGYDYLAPIFTIGKYLKQGEEILLPLAVQVHHSVCDGYHTVRLVNELQEWADAFMVPPCLE